MRILYCNKYNFPFSGTEVYIFEAMKLMRSRGHEAALFSMADVRGEPTAFDQHFMPHINFKGQSGCFERVKQAANMVYSFEARRRIRAMIKAFRPHVAHVRNIYHHLSPSILWELKAQNVPVIYHLNDFKVLCPSYNLVLRGEACEACKGGHFWHAVTEKCYPGFAQRLALVAEAYFHKAVSTYRKCVDCFLAPSRFVRDKFIEHGWDPAKFQVLPHFQTTRMASNCPKNGPLLYFGRLSPEKGVDDLLRAMQRLPHLRLKIAGEGPERGALSTLSLNLGLKNVEFIGQLGREDLEREIIRSRFTVLPSHAYETLGKTILESHALARAVVASDLGSRRELIEDGKNGLLYKTGDVPELVAALEFLSSRSELAEKMGLAGKEKVERSFTPESHYQVLIELYERMWEEKKLACAKPKRRGWGDGTRNSSKPPAMDVIPALAKTRPLRVAFIGGRGVFSKYSGIETYYEEVGERLAQMGHEVTAYCRTYFTPAVKEHKGMKVVLVPTIRSKHSETALHTLLSTLHVLTKPCDIVHYHALGPALFSFIPRLLGKKTVVTVQGLDWQRKKWGRIASAVLRVGERAAVRLPSRTIVVSRTLQRHYRQHHAAETTYVPNGGLLREHRCARKILEWGLAPQRYILFLGRLSPEKGCHLLVEAYETLSTEIKLVLAGAASYCDDYSRVLRSHGSDRIKILDWVSGETLDELLTNALIFVMPSDLEGLSLALLDAMGAGLCVLASDIPENREAVEDAGFTFRRGDVCDLADRLRFLIANPAVRDAAGQAAKRRIAEHYQWDGIASEVEQVYLNVLGVSSSADIKKPSGRVTSEIDPASGRKAG